MRLSENELPTLTAQPNKVQNRYLTSSI